MNDIRWKIGILTVLVLFCSCSKDDVEIENSNGTKLISIDYSYEENEWSEYYYYNSKDQLVEMEDLRSLGRRYEFLYSDDKVEQIETYRISDNRIVFRDSIAYNDAGEIDRIYSYSINLGDDLPLNLIYEFEYDDAGNIVKKTTYSDFYGENPRIQKYYWTDGNVTRAEEWSGDQLVTEYFYTYDDKIYYKKDARNYATGEVIKNRNNVKSISFKDYSGLVDAICNPCESSYTYNLDDYPVKITTSYGRTMRINYE
ncbi:hypothetical protein SLH46_16635 [Draconibacterium sp. IB214405]|uniref:hypothetical protein n=1 Tax=Draconibacterium sp. IB214405 TaxID=3097352 RepID=UPI002A0B3746|nr:hypothetical protein [Draconibacterium sp. IB214405]MDX8340826.1 hypothetical protein [Draconibacterium sp. IB214405]